MLSDVMMPVVDGFELIRRIRCNPTWAGLPVILRLPDGSGAALSKGGRRAASKNLHRPESA